MQKIFLVETEDENIIMGENVKNIVHGDQIVYQDDISRLVNMEMDENCHTDYPEDYDSLLEFYLSNVEEDSFVDWALPQILDTVQLTEAARRIIREEVACRIKEKCSTDEA